MYRVIRGFWYVIFQISRDLIPAAYENKKKLVDFPRLTPSLTCIGRIGNPNDLHMQMSYSQELVSFLDYVSPAGMLKRYQHDAAVRKHGTITQCCFNDGPALKTVGQH